jgi:hypothetical protein
MLREKLKETINRKKYVRNYNKKIFYSHLIFMSIFFYKSCKLGSCIIIHKIIIKNIILFKNMTNLDNI